MSMPGGLQTVMGLRDAVKKTLASGVIVAVVGFQVLVGFGWINDIPRMRHRKGYYYPFLDYPMYKGAHYPGERFDRYVVVGTLSDGTQRPILPADLGLNFWKFDKGPVRALQQGDAGTLQPYLQHYWHRHHRCLTEVRLENHPSVLGASGLTTAPVEVVRAMRAGEELCR